MIITGIKKKYCLIGTFSLLLFCIGCAQKHTDAASRQQETDHQWNYPRISAYLSEVPGIREMSPWDEGYGQGICIQTDHYRIYTTLTDPLILRQAPSFVESAYKAYESQLPDKVGGKEKFKTYLFADRKGWEDFTRKYQGPDAEVYLKIQRGAYAKDGICVAYNIGRRQTFSILGHEGWHQFNQLYFRYRLPSWLDEGIATLFETCRYEQGQFVFRPQDNMMRLGTLRQAIQNGRMIPLAELITLNPGEVLSGYGSDTEAAMAFYAQNYALVRFLREYEYGKRLKYYHNMLLGGLRGNWSVDSYLTRIAADRNEVLTIAWNKQVSRQLFNCYITSDISEIDKEYRSFCNDIIYRIRIISAPGITQ